jgi:hypothetical protein
MTSPDVVEMIAGLSDGDLLDLLESVSDEVKRRSSLVGPDVGKVLATEEGIMSVVESLADLGVMIKSKGG